MSVTQGVAEPKSDRTSACDLVASQSSGPVTTEATMKRKAEMEFVDEQHPVKKMKSGKIYDSCCSAGCGIW